MKIKKCSPAANRWAAAYRQWKTLLEVDPSLENDAKVGVTWMLLDDLPGFLKKIHPPNPLEKKLSGKDHLIVPNW